MISKELKAILDEAYINGKRIITTPVSLNEERVAKIDYEREMTFLAQGQTIMWDSIKTYKTEGKMRPAQVDDLFGFVHQDKSITSTDGGGVISHIYVAPNADVAVFEY
jgi:hypothetical protein